MQTHSTVMQPSDIMCMAELLLRWPEDTLKHIKRQMKTPVERGALPGVALPIYVFQSLHFQKEPTEQHNYKGFLIRLSRLLSHQEGRSIGNLFSNIFFMRKDVIEIEKNNRHYIAFYRGKPTAEQSTICTLKNIHIVGAQILFDILESHYFIDKITPIYGELVEDAIWPWFGPVDPPLIDVTLPMERTLSHEQKHEMELFIRAARELGQNSLSCLARMIKNNYPQISYPLLVDLLEPDAYRTAASKRKQGRRLCCKD